MNWLNKYFDFENGKNKLLVRLIILAIVGVMFLIAGSSLFGDRTGKDKGGQSETKAESLLVKAPAGSIERQAEEMLSQIEGAGKVKIMISYVSSGEIVPAVNIKKSDSTTSEKDTQGGTRSIGQNQYESTIIYEEEQGGVKKPIILKELHPQVKGVLVIAEGAGDPMVKEKLSRAVQVLMDIPLNKIQVLEKNKEGSK